MASFFCMPERVASCSSNSLLVMDLAASALGAFSPLALAAFGAGAAGAAAAFLPLAGVFAASAAGAASFFFAMILSVCGEPPEWPAV